MVHLVRKTHLTKHTQETFTLHFGQITCYFLLLYFQCDYIKDCRFGQELCVCLPAVAIQWHLQNTHIHTYKHNIPRHLTTASFIWSVLMKLQLVLGHPTAIFALSRVSIGSGITHSYLVMPWQVYDTLISRHYPKLICFALVSFITKQHCKMYKRLC